MKRFKNFIDFGIMYHYNFMLVILGFRYWLKNNLPQYIQEKTPRIILLIKI